MTSSHSANHGRWAPASTEPEHLLAQIDASAVGAGVTLAVELGPKNSVGARYFRCFLDGGFGRSPEPLLLGMQNSGPFPGFNWVEVLYYRDELSHPDPAGDGNGSVVYAQITEGIELRVFEQLARLVPAGGHLMAEYESPARRMTARALVVGVPPAATPLGAVLRAVGCGVALRDWYIPEGGREGPRKLQGFRALDAKHERTRAAETVAALERYLSEVRDIEWDIQARCRALAMVAIEELRPVISG